MTTVKSTQRNDKTTDIGGLQTLLMANGEVFANFTEMPRDIVEIAIGSASAQMRGCAPDALASFGAALLNGLDSRDLKNSIWSEPAEKVPGDTYAVWINELADWALSGTQTIQIMLVDRNAPCRIKIDHPIVIKGDTSDLFLRAHIASHRSKAMLHVTFSDSATREIRTCKVAFAPSFLVGVTLRGISRSACPCLKVSGQWK